MPHPEWLGVQMSLKLVLFDCDGTLVNSGHGIIDCMQHAFVAAGHAAPAPSEVLHVVGLSLPQAIYGIRADLAAKDAEIIEESYKARFKQQRLAGELDQPLYAGAVATIKQLNDAGYLLGVATGKSRRGLDAVLAAHGLASQFVTLQTADRVRAGKPAPDMVLQACDETGVDPSAVIVVGDTTYDLEMAHNAGAAAIGVTWGYHPEDLLLETGCRHIARQFDDVPGFVEDLYRAGW